jgi:hypothetical protein
MQKSGRTSALRFLLCKIPHAVRGKADCKRTEKTKHWMMERKRETRFSDIDKQESGNLGNIENSSSIPVIELG